MPTTIQELQQQRVALVAALGSGELKIVFHSGGTRREVEFRSVPDLERAIAAIDREIAAHSGRRPTTFKAFFPEEY